MSSAAPIWETTDAATADSHILIRPLKRHGTESAEAAIYESFSGQICSTCALRASLWLHVGCRRLARDAVTPCRHSDPRAAAMLPTSAGDVETVSQPNSWSPLQNGVGHSYTVRKTYSVGLTAQPL